MYIDKEKYLKEKDNILKFLKEHRYLYDDKEYEMLFSIISFDILLENDGYSTNCNIATLLSKYNVFTEENDRYLKFYKMLEELNFIKGNSLEVGSGPYPRLAEVIKDNHKRIDYNLTIYEKCNVFYKKLPKNRAVLHRFNISPLTDLMFGQYYLTIAIK